MSSLRTNSTAMVALNTLRAINKSMGTIQNRISTSLRVADASDNAAYWSIATTMKSDNKALSAVQDAWGLGAATIDVALTAMDKSIKIVNQIKAKLAAATDDTVDKRKIQSDITDCRGSLKRLLPRPTCQVKTACNKMLTPQASARKSLVQCEGMARTLTFSSWRSIPRVLF